MLAIWSLAPLPFLNPAWTSGSSQFTYCWNLTWRILSITLLACEMSAIVQQFEHSLALEWKLNFSSPVATAEFSKFAGIFECSTFIASSFRIWNSSTGIPSSALALLEVVLPMAHLTSYSGFLALGEWSHHHGYLDHDLFLYSSSVYSSHLFLISSAYIRSKPFLSFIGPIYKRFPGYL